MSFPSEPQSPIRFGEFQLDLETAELRTQGTKTSLQGQPLQILTALLENPGRLVTRDELKKRLWSPDTFVDFDQSLNRAVNRLREALGDSAEQPRFIETIPRLGYRFISEISQNGQPAVATWAQGDVQASIAQLEVGENQNNESESIQVLGNAQATALGAETNQPRYVETIPRGGYRFIAPVTGQIPTEPTSLTPPLIFGTAVEASVPRPRRRGGRLAILATVCLLGATGITAVLLWRHMENRPLAETSLITSDAWSSPRLSRDGKLLAYTASDSLGLTHIWMRQTAGGAAIQITHGPEGEGMGDFSPDGTNIVFVSSGSLYIKPTLSGEPKLIASEVHADHPYFSSNGEKVTYFDSEKRVAMAVSLATGEQSPIHTNPDLFIECWPFWPFRSPNGDEVILGGVDKRDPSKRLRWWIVTLTTGKARPVDLPDGDPFEGWIRDKDGGEWILYSVNKGELWELFRIRLKDAQIEGKPDLLVSGTGTLPHGNALSISEDGKLAYSASNYRESIYEIPIGGRGERSGPTLQLRLPDGDAFRSPVLSRDGRWMVYDAWRLGKSYTVKVRDLRNGTDRSLDEVDGRVNPGEVTISPDGSKVVLERECKDLKWLNGFPLPCGFVMPVGGGKLEQICESCTARGFSSDGSVVLTQKYNEHLFNESPPRIAAVNLTSKTEIEFLRSPDNSLWHAFFSWDDHWVVFKKLLGKSRRAQLMIAPVRNGVAGSERKWIPITDGRHNDDKPQFSPDGKLVYFTSTRDGYLCVWAQRLDSATKRPVGEPVAYEHFHNAVGLGGSYEGAMDNSNLSVSRDKMVINLPQFSNNIWMARIEQFRGR